MEDSLLSSGNESDISDDGIGKSDDEMSIQHSNERSKIISTTNRCTCNRINEDTPLITSNMTHKVYSDLKQEVTNISMIQSFQQSSIFGLSSATVATIGQRDFGISKTLSLLDVPSTDRRTSNTVLFISLVSMLTSISVFALPLAVARCGLPMLAMIAMLGMLLCYTTLLINRCQHQISKNGTKKRVYTSFVDMGKAAIPWQGETVMKLFVASNIMTDIYILIFCAQVTLDLFQGVFYLDKRVWALIWITAVFPIFLIPRMSTLTWFGLVSLLFCSSGLFLAFGLMIMTWGSWSLKNVDPTFSVKYFFISFGVIINSYNMHLAVPVMEATMVHPKNFAKLTTSAFALNTVIKIVFALIGAFNFGMATQGSVLSNFTGTNYAIVLQIVAAFGMYFMYPTSVFVISDMADNYIKPKIKYFNLKSKQRYWVWVFFSRFFMSAFIASVAICVPNFEMVTSFVGNIRGTLITIVLPVFFYLRLQPKRISMASKILHWALIILSSAMGLIGAGFAIHGMVYGS